jgi:hypothetical protein
MTKLILMQKVRRRKSGEKSDMKPDILTILKEIEGLDLTKYPNDHAKKLIQQLGRFGCISINLHKGKTIMRARPNFGAERFLCKCDYTYKPQRLNNTFQRASTPQRTMFYASTIPETRQTGELDNPRLIGSYEAMPWLRDKTSKGVKKISFGRWLVTKDIKLLAIVQHDEFYNKSSYTRELADAFRKFTSTHPELESETLAISDFFAKEYAKETIRGDYDYLLSAIFTEQVVDAGMDGVLYPSVRVGGQGFNIAITPEVADTCLDLVVAGECTIYKYQDQIVVDNETGIELRHNQTHFDLRAMGTRDHIGQNECLKLLGLKRISDLT